MVARVERREVVALDLVWLLAWRWRMCGDGIRVWVRGVTDPKDPTEGEWIHEAITVFPPPDAVRAWLKRT